MLERKGSGDLFNRVIFENINYLKLIKEDFTCQFCDSKTSKPRMCEICKNVYCKKCISFNDNQIEKACPSSNKCTPFITKRISTMDLINRSLNKIMLSCNNGCGGVLSLLDYFTFLRKKDKKSSEGIHQPKDFLCSNCMKGNQSVLEDSINTNMINDGVSEVKKELKVKRSYTVKNTNALAKEQIKSELEGELFVGKSLSIEEEAKYQDEIRKKRIQELARIQKEKEEKEKKEKEEQESKSPQLEKKTIEMLKNISSISSEKASVEREVKEEVTEKTKNEESRNTSFDSSWQAKKQKTTIKEAFSITTKSQISCLTAFQLGQNQFIATGHKDKAIRVWNLDLSNLDTPKIKEGYELLGHKGLIYHLTQFNQNNQAILASSSEDFAIKLWNLSTKKLITTLYGHQNFVTSVITVETKKETLLASSSWDHSIKLWNPPKYQNFSTLLGHNKSVTCLVEFQIQDEDSLVISGSEDKIIKIWNPRSCKLQGNLQGHEDIISTLTTTYAFGLKVVVSGSDDRSLKIWNPINKSLLLTLSGHQDFIFSVCSYIKENNHYIVSGGKEKVIKVWEADKQGLIHNLEGHEDEVWCVTTIKVDDTVIVISGAFDKSLKLWQV